MQLFAHKVWLSGKVPFRNDPQGGWFWERGWVVLGKKVGGSGKEPSRHSLENKAFSSFFGSLYTFQIYILIHGCCG
jgi:hypothetical protein